MDGKNREGEEVLEVEIEVERRKRKRKRRRKRKRKRRRKRKSTHEYKGKTDSNNPIGLNEAAVCLHYYYNTYFIETKGKQSERLLPTHPSL